MSGTTIRLEGLDDDVKTSQAQAERLLWAITDFRKNWPGHVTFRRCVVYQMGPLRAAVYRTPGGQVVARVLP